jgi:hypothetical protein
MNALLRAGGICICMALPAVSMASTVNFQQAGSQYTLLFDPHGATTCQLPSPCVYRSYDCRIGTKPVVTVYLPPPTPKIFPPSNPPSKGNTPVLPPGPPDDNNPSSPGCADAVPAPAAAQVGLVGLAAAAMCSWLRKKHQARA